jgi:ribonuclease HII
MSRPSSGPDFAREAQARIGGHWPVAGVDEAGRGPWAGPVVAAAVILNPDNIPAGLDDSKKLKEARREARYRDILSTATVAVASVAPATIDRIGVGKASLLALASAVRALAVAPRLVLVDGRERPDLAMPCQPIIDGDALVLSIAAASIVAKVTRDRMMVGLDGLYPGYGFASHKGYGTAAHGRALASLGPCPAHRASFAPVARALPGADAR